MAGPCSTEPSAAENTLPWQAQLILPSATDDTRQPWWVHTALKALKVPATRLGDDDLAAREDHAAADGDVGLGRGRCWRRPPRSDEPASPTSRRRR